MGFRDALPSGAAPRVKPEGATLRSGVLNRHTNLLACSGQHIDQGVDGELHCFFVDDIRNARPRHAQYLRRLHLLEIVLVDPQRQLGHQRLLDGQLFRNDALGLALQSFGLLRLESQIGKDVTANPLGEWLVDAAPY